MTERERERESFGSWLNSVVFNINLFLQNYFFLFSVISHTWPFNTKKLPKTIMSDSSNNGQQRLDQQVCVCGLLPLIFFNYEFFFFFATLSFFWDCIVCRLPALCWPTVVRLSSSKSSSSRRNKNRMSLFFFVCVCVFTVYLFVEAFTCRFAGYGNHQRDCLTFATRFSVPQWKLAKVPQQVVMSALSMEMEMDMPQQPMAMMNTRR